MCFLWCFADGVVEEALAAFVERSSSRPGMSWRVGVVPQYTEEAFNEARKSLNGLSSMRKQSSKMLVSSHG